MPVIQINTPNLAAELVSIIALEKAITDNAPINIDTFIDLCFKLKPTQDCNALILHDYTDYTPLGDNIDFLTITFGYGYKTDCGCEMICDGLPFTPNSQYTIDNLINDGVYGVSINFVYDDGINVYTKTIMQSYEKDCCDKEYELLAHNIWARMSDVSCQINCLQKIGRNVKKLKESYLKMSNLLWLYYNSIDSCNERDKVFCLYNKIK